MATRWSTSQLIAEHKELQAVCLAVSGDGRCALSSRRTISLINCNQPEVVDFRIRRETKWDSTASEFNPLDTNLMAITNAQTVQVYNIEANIKNTSSGMLSAMDSSNGSGGSYTVVKELQLVTLRGHTRTVTDLNWSYNDTNLLATASYDNYVYVWDIRDYRKPQLSMSSVAGATQVKWSKLNEHLLATSHEGDVRVWDRRKCNTPLHYITAHLSKINGLDWSPTIASQFATCSQDGSVRFWDLTTSKSKPDAILPAGLPVWRARFTPFGNGIVTALVPQLRRSSEYNSLWMWSMNCFDQPMHSFVGHLDVVLDFGWHNKNNGNEYELITWSKDNSLRIWKVDSELMARHNDELYSTSFDLNIDDPNDNHSSTGSADGSDGSSSTNKRPLSIDISRSPNRHLLRNTSGLMSHSSSDLMTKRSLMLTTTSSATMTTTSSGGSTVPSLTQEFSLININIPNVQIEELNASKRVCIITATTSITCRLKMTFPSGYPNHVTPHFTFLNGSTTPSDDIKKELLKVLHMTAVFQVKRNRTCLEPCLRQFIATLERLTGTSSTSIMSATHSSSLLTCPPLSPSHHYGSYLDSHVPFPRTSGARFCSGELLVCFGRPPHLDQINAPIDHTPRSLSDLDAYLSTHYRSAAPHNNKDVDVIEHSISSFYFDASKRHAMRNNKIKRNSSGDYRNSASPRHRSNSCGPVFIFSVAGLLPISRNLAENYVFPINRDIISMCEINARVANTFGRRDLCQTWNLVKLSADIYIKSANNGNLMETPWALHPFGKKMIQSLIEHSVLKCNDIQTAAMLASTFHMNETKPKFVQKTSQSGSGNNSPGNSPYHTVGSAIVTPNTPETYGDWNLISAMESLKRTRSNSWSDFAENEALIAGLINNRSDNLSEQLELETHETNNKMLEPKLQFQFDCYKQIYADILYRWQLMDKRALILKSCTNINQSQLFPSGVDFVTECQNPVCEKQYTTSRAPYCSHCRQPTLKCVICRMPVRGAVNHCVRCGHGGHTVHMYNWFTQSDECPSGCGCHCLQENSNIFA
ncbi:GATOR complex protein WDR59-like isoform X2 [Oppia nitens]|uniref:GATOR complex protein WDR59-like isoform X2 n=1 Tax=Oppia nitens TaxID=1686743 RepID=UPI0023DB5A1E|nr:GATOR complex protein WDR59-like isoform X2 [Oppia nitens]